MNQRSKNWTSLSRNAKERVWTKFVLGRAQRQRQELHVGPKKTNPDKLNPWWIKHKKYLPLEFQKKMEKSPEKLERVGRRRVMEHLRVHHPRVYREILEEGHHMPVEMWDTIEDPNRENKFWRVNFVHDERVLASNTKQLRAFLNVLNLNLEPSAQVKAFYAFVMDPATSLKDIKTSFKINLNGPPLKKKSKPS
jgi:hypothetical protein